MGVIVVVGVVVVGGGGRGGVVVDDGDGCGGLGGAHVEAAFEVEAQAAVGFVHLEGVRVFVGPATGFCLRK